MMAMPLEIIIGLEVVAAAALSRRMDQRRLGTSVNLNARPLAGGRAHDVKARVRLLVKAMAPRAAR